jgi:HD superfamily phosphohydrolase
MYLLVRRAFDPTKAEWELLACLVEETIGGCKPLMRNGDAPMELMGMKERTFLVEFVGAGTFGIVIRAVDRMGVDRAFKVFLPPRALQVQGIDTHIPEGMASYTDYDEITLTNRQPFKHVLSVAHHGKTLGTSPPNDLPPTIKINPAARAIRANEELPFTVSPLVDGFHMDGFFRLINQSTQVAILDDRVGAAALHDHVLLLFRDVLAGLVELREADVVHLDIKAHNIMVHAPAALFHPLKQAPTSAEFIMALKDRGKRWEAFIVDLGISRCVALDRHGWISLVMTPLSFPTDVLHLLEEDAEKRGYVNIDRLREYGAAIDLNMFGRVIWSMLMDQTELNKHSTYSQDFKDRERVKTDFWKRIFRADYGVIAGLARELVKSNLKPWVDPAESLRRLQTIPLYSDKDIYASSLLTDRQPEIKIRCGGTLVRLGEPLDEVVDHPYFQRLRRMAQLAFVSEVFPDANHTRFSHSLRTFELAKEAVRFLTPKSLFRVIFTRKDVDHLLAAALLHDIGQYPFAHTIEELRELGEHKQVQNAPLMRISHDHELVKSVLTRPDKRGRTIGDILKAHGFSVDDILYCIHKNPESHGVSPALRVSHELIAQVVDLDRIAYLLQDSERSGVPYGNAIDVESLLDALTVAGSYDDLGQHPEKLGLGIEESGVSAAEAVLAAVYWMYRNVYWRHTNRAFMTMIKTVIKSLIAKGNLDFDTYWRETLQMSEMDALRYLHDKFNTHKEANSVNPLTSLLELRRVGYSRVKTVNVIHRDTPEEEEAATVHHLIMRRLSVWLEEDVAVIVEDYLRTLGVDVRRRQVLVDIPLKRHLRERQGLPVIGHRHLSRRRRDAAKDLFDYSRLSAKLTEIEEESFVRIRIFFAKELIEQLSQPIMEEIEKSLLGAIRLALDSSTPGDGG